MSQKPKNKDEFRAEMADAFIHVLEERGLEWKKDWAGQGGGAPHNGITKACYRGCNAFWLSLVSMLKGYDDPRWVTMVQIMDNDGKYHPKEKWHLKKGSKATYVEYWMPFDTVKHKAVTWEQFREDVKNGREESDFGLISRYTGVFNARDVEGMPELTVVQNEDITADELITRLSVGMGVPIFNDGGDRAYYSPSEDQIHLPTPESFGSEYAYNATALHELSHSSGHPSRLDRIQGSFFGSAEYAYEELVAEICSAFMGYDLNTEATPEHINNHKAYVQSWIQAIRDKPDTLVKAIKDAQTAANYMDFKAGLITETEHAKACASIKEVKQKSIEYDR